MAAHQVNITDRAKRYRAQNNVTGPRKCVLCGSRSDLGVMHLTGNESHGERENLAYGCRSCNGKLAAAFKALNLGKPTNQYNPSSGVPTFEQYMWAVSNHSRGAHDAGGAVIHATPKHKRIEYARRIVSKAQATKRDRLDDRWNPAEHDYLRSRGWREVVTKRLGLQFGHGAQFGLRKWEKSGQRAMTLKEALRTQRKEDNPKDNPFRPGLADSIRRMIDKKGGDYERLGLRADKRALRIGSVAPVSRVWDDGSPIREKLDGTAALEVTSGSVESVLQQLENYTHLGSRISLIGSEFAYEGQDSGERVFQKAKVLGTWVKGWVSNPANPWPFSRPDARRTTPAHGGIAYHQGKRKARKSPDDLNAEYLKSLAPAAQKHAKSTTFKGRAIKPTESGAWVVPSIDKESEFDTVQDAKAFITSWKRNPASASAEVFEDFHGFEPTEVVTVSKEVHHHAHLASLGELVQLDVWGVDGKGHKVTGFKGALLACNEGRDQLFVEGGDQTMNLADFGIRKPHETETLGRVTNIGYQTNKTHLGDEGGEAVYVHRFRATNQNGKHVVVKMTREPDLIYDVRNEQLLFSGGSYEILREGINK